MNATETTGSRPGDLEGHDPTSGARAKRLQMADIARMAGVSTTTVSRALSGSALVNQSTRKRVTELARSLNYTVNAGAKELRQGHRNTVAVAVPYDVGSRRPFADSFQLAILGSIADALGERGYDMLLSRVDEGNLQLASAPFDCGRTMGVILVGQGHQHDHLNRLAARGVPLVVWGAQLPNQLYCTVGGNDVEGGRLATAYLLGKGRRRIAFLGDTGLAEAAQRLEGHRRALADAGVLPDAALAVRTTTLAESARAAIKALRTQGTAFDAVFCCSDLLAMAAIGALLDLGLRVPQDVAVVGYDDVELAACFHPALTTVREPVEAGGRALVAALLSFLDNVKPTSQVLASELVVRASA